MDDSEIKIKLEEAGLPADIVDDIISQSKVNVPQNKEQEVKEAVAQMRIQYDLEQDKLKKAAIMARIISYRIDNYDY